MYYQLAVIRANEALHEGKQYHIAQKTNHHPKKRVWTILKKWLVGQPICGSLHERYSA